MDKELTSERKTINDLEQQIKNNQFKSKEELFQALSKLKNEGLLDNDEIKQLLDLYDKVFSQSKEPSLDMKNYSIVELDEKNLIVSKEDDRVLATLNDRDKFVDEFKQVQNEITATNIDGVSNADEVFQHIAKYEKQEITLMSLTDAIEKNSKNISKEVLIKIRIFITNKYVDPQIYKVNIDTGIFYNVETNEVYEVIKNEITNKYEIYKDGEKVYGNNSEEQQELPLEKDTDEEKKPYERANDKQKVRILMKPKINNAAFTKIGFLLINVLTFAALITMMLLLKK